MKTHYLRNIRMVAHPPVVLAVGLATGTRTTGRKGSKRKWITCNAWTLQYHDLRYGEKHHVETVSGTDPVDLWRNVRGALDQGHITWLWCFGMRELLALTDWYTLLELGQWTIGGKDHGAEIEESLGVQKHFRGYMIDSDPPNIVLCMDRTSGRVLQIVDVKNFGIETWEQLTPPSDRDHAGLHNNLTGVNGIVRQGMSRAACIANWAISWSRLVTEQHWGPLRPSIAGQAMVAYRCKFLKHPILIHDNFQARRLERDAYFTGRCEAYRIGQVYGPVYHLDIQSCYPSVSRDCLCPSRLGGYSNDGRADIGKLASNGWCVIADVTLCTGRADFPYRVGREVIYPTGIFRTALCWPELSFAFERDEVKAVHRVVWYEPYQIFKDWTDEMLAIRNAANVRAVPGMLVAVKGLTNSLYGTWAKRSRRWIDCTCTPPLGPYAMWYGEQPAPHKCPGHVCKPPSEECWFHQQKQVPVTRFRSIAWRVQYESATVDAEDTFPAIAAWVSSLARATLLEMLRAVDKGGVYYCDTDSIWCSQSAYDQLAGAGHVHSNTPGKLKEVARFPTIYIHGHKTYIAGKTGARCGVPSTAAIDDYGNAEWWGIEGMESSMRRNERPHVMLSIRRRSITNNYTGGTVKQDGTVEPLHIMEVV